MENNDLFRKKAVERISSPEKLNDYIHVTSPSIWMALGAIILILVGALVWATFGNIYTTVNGAGVVRDENLVIYVKVSDRPSVKEGMEITVNGRSARSYASQGQTRTAALSLKLAEREIFLAETGEYPILLLDDVLSELDVRRQEFVLNRIGGGQTLITCCEDAQIAEKTGGRVIMIDGGQVI